MVEALAPQEKVDGAHDPCRAGMCASRTSGSESPGRCCVTTPRLASTSPQAWRPRVRSATSPAGSAPSSRSPRRPTDWTGRSRTAPSSRSWRRSRSWPTGTTPRSWRTRATLSTTTAASIGHQPLLLVATALADLSRALSAAPPAQRAAPEGGTDAAVRTGRPEPTLAAISTLESTGVRAWQAPITHILEAWGRQDAPDQIRASAETGGYQSADQATTTGGLAADVDSPRDGPRDDGDLSGSADDPAQAAPTQPAAELGPSPEARAAIRNRDWGRAASQLRIDLDDLEWRTPQDRASRNTAALLASVLTSCLEFFPQHRERLGAEILDLAARYGAQLLEDVRAGRSGDSGPAAAMPAAPPPATSATR